MLRGYRCIVIAAFGWLSLAASPAPDNGAQADQAAPKGKISKADQHVAAAITEAAKPSEKDRGCTQGKEERQSDLCAQWKAADAASDAARWAMASLFVGIVGTGLLVWTLWETRQSSRRELRAYLFADSVGCYEIWEPKKNRLGRTKKHKTGIVGATVFIKNSGQTPAYKVRHIGEVAICKCFEESLLEIGDGDIKGFLNQIPASGVIHKFRRMAHAPSEEQIAGLKTGNYAVYVFGRIDYEDAFKRRHFTNYKFFYSAWPIPDELTMSFAESGNTAT
jgi:hypothetical protein